MKSHNTLHKMESFLDTICTEILQFQIIYIEKKWEKEKK